MKKFNIGFLGAGKMATAIAMGLIKAGHPRTRIKTYDISVEAAKKFSEVTGVKSVRTPEKLSENTDVILIAVKPQQIYTALTEIKDFLSEQLLVSIAAGVTLQKLHTLSGYSLIVRVMPNTPMLIGQGVSAYSTVKNLPEKYIKMVEYIFRTGGICLQVEEKLMDAVTGLSGSGPAYVFEFIQGLANGAVRAGLPRNIALRFAAATVAGAAQMVTLTNEHPAVLKDQVTSPAGTTAEGLAVLDKYAFGSAIAEAVYSAAKRSAELSDEA